MIRMVQREYIRDLFFREGRSVRQIARMVGCHRKTVKRYIQNPDHSYPRTAPVVYPVLGPYLATIDAWLVADQQAPPKQRHTARRIWQRLRDEYGFQGGESTVREYVRRWKRAQRPKEVFLPLAFAKGESMQVDWGEVTVGLEPPATGNRKVFMFCARLAYSTDIYVRLYPHSRTEAFLDGLRRAFEFFGGVPREAVFDNLRTAVKRFVTHYEREETEAFLAFRTYYVFQARFCTIAKGNEKGLMENLVGYARRNFLVPVPTVASTDPQGLEALNGQLEQACLENRQRKRSGDSRTVGELYQEEQSCLLALPPAPYNCAQRVECKVDTSLRVRFETNTYSVPYAYAGRHVELKAYVDRIDVVCDGQLIARHPRCYGRSQQILDLRHYLEVLQRKPGGLRHSRAWQQRDLPDVYAQLLDVMVAENRKTEEFIRVLILRRDHGDPASVDKAVQLALQRHCARYDAIALLCQPSSPEPAGETGACLVPAPLQATRVDRSRFQPGRYQQLVGVGG